MTTLAALPPGDSLSFGALRDTLDMTVGNLSTHLSKLEGGDYVTVEKTYQGRKPITYLCLTDKGRRAFDRYLTDLRTLLGDLP